MNNFLVLIHDVYTGNVVRQFVTSAENAEQAVEKYARLMQDGTEHAIAIPTGSEPDPVQPEDTPAAPAEPAETAATAEPEAADDMETHSADLISDELLALPEHLLTRVLEKLRNRGQD